MVLRVFEPSGRRAIEVWISRLALAAALLATLGAVFLPGDARAGTAQAFTRFRIAKGRKARYITRGSDGNLWFTEWVGNRTGRITPGGKVTEFTLPIPKVDGSVSYEIVAGPDGNVWFTVLRVTDLGPSEAGNAIGRITPRGTIRLFPVSQPVSDPLGITTGPDGNLWFTEAHECAPRPCLGPVPPYEIERITPAGAITSFALPATDGAPTGIARGADGNLWFIEESQPGAALLPGGIGRITPRGTLTEFPLPVGGHGPLQIISGPERSLWFTDERGIQRMNLHGAITGTFPATSPAGIRRGITVGPEGDIWFTEFKHLARVLPSGARDQIAIPEGLYPDKITTENGNLWFTSGNEIVRLDPRLLPQCRVPRLRGRTLATAKKLLASAGCALGRVTSTGPKTPRLVVSQEPGAGRRLPSGTLVNLRLE